MVIVPGEIHGQLHPYTSQALQFKSSVQLR